MANKIIHSLGWVVIEWYYIESGARHSLNYDGQRMMQLPHSVKCYTRNGEVTSWFMKVISRYFLPRLPRMVDLQRIGPFTFYLIGLYLGWLRLKSKSRVWGIISHPFVFTWLNNCIVYIAGGSINITVSCHFGPFFRSIKLIIY